MSPQKKERIATFSKRKPVSNVKVGLKADDLQYPQVSIPISREAPTQQSNREKDGIQKYDGTQSIRDQWLDKLRKTVRGMEIIGPSYQRSRKSELRPARPSIAPTREEFSDLLSLCRQGTEGAKEFEEWIDGFRDFVKIGESSFSEVFKARKRKSGEVKEGEEDDDEDDEWIAVKIMPLLNPEDGNETMMKEHDQDHLPSPEPIELPKLFHEIRCLSALEALRTQRKYALPIGHTGFNKFISCSVVRGEYPSILLGEWDKWTDGGNETFNDHPSFYRKDSHHAIIEMEFGGQDLETFTPTTLPQLKSILLQILTAIDLAESSLDFEHRDLHPGNILIQPTHRADIRLQGYRSIATEGFLISIIDCSLSRLMGDDGHIHFRNLNEDGWLFEGDAEQSRQYQIYRDMHSLFKANTLDFGQGEGENGAEVNVNWKQYLPRSNLIWIAYIMESLLDRLPGKRNDANNAAKSAFKEYIQSLSNFDTCAKAITAFNQQILDNFEFKTKNQ